MGREIERHLGDVVAELIGAVALGVGASVSGSLLALRFDWPMAPLCLGGALAGMILGWAAVHAVPGAAPLALPAFAPGDVVADEPPSEELLLDQVVTEREPRTASRVVQLFAPEPIQTAGQLKERIDRHLDQSSSPDASEALHAALDEIRRTLRQR